MGATEIRRAGGRGGRSSGVPGAIWLREAPEPRGTTPLSRGRIVAAAIELLDAEGVRHLTMRRLAEHLGAGPTTLYWYVRTKDDVIDLALDAIFGEVATPEDGEWTTAVRGLIRAWRAAMLRHPWSAALIGRPMLGPNVLQRTEFLHATLAAAGFGGVELVAAAHALANYVIGASLTQASWHESDLPGAAQAADDHVRDRADEYPTLAATTGLHSWDDTFERGLDVLLAGLERTRSR
jgi:AcrR family transcriptional regulator